MGKFTLARKFSLAFLGEEWKECYLTINAITINDLENEFVDFMSLSAGTQDKEETRKTFAKARELIQRNFVEGKAFSNGKLVDVTAEDIKEFPASVLTEVISFLSADLTEKK